MMGQGRKQPNRLPHRLGADAKEIVKLSPYVQAQHDALILDGYVLNKKVRCYPCRDGSTTLQFTWLKREVSAKRRMSRSFTMTLRGIE